MKTTMKLTFVLALAAILAMSACTPPTTPVANTQDAATMYTQAAATVAANLTQEAIQNPQPTDTPEPPTATVPPTEEAPLATATSDPALPSPTSQTPEVVPSATSAAGGTAPLLGDMAELVGQSPEDDTPMALGSVFNTHLTFKNTGTTTWTKEYALRFYAGEKLGAPNDYYLTNEVKPGESVTIIFEMKPAASKGETNTIFVLTNKDGVNFYSMYLRLRWH